MFGFGKQKKDSYQETNQDDYFYDDYEEGYEDDYGYDSYPEEEYERPVENYREYGREERRSRRRTEPSAEERYDGRYSGENEPMHTSAIEEEQSRHQEPPLQQEVERLEETVAQLKHQLEVKQTEMTGMATTLTEKDQALQEYQTKAEQQVEALREEKERELQALQTENQQKIQAQLAAKDRQINELKDQLTQLKSDLQKDQTYQSEALAQAQRQIDTLRQTQKENEDMKAELATILIETKKQERAILERAEYEAKGIRSQAEQEAHQVIHDASLELRVMKQEIRNYRKRLRSVQEETTQFFVRLLATSDNLLDDE
ncbi:hypothetical protein [Enterococcus pallens]|uniref:Uncharacterized protein n=1 Tax=Enterococcus pallens ATCC BAA-351 TaxID=1158607 RepID=R2T564_9ENTE|nr:hypothetical protein [Enterococcus pallens]EOH95379.1 hypothetical protein UAU_01341 [Enterococcus pallens ATCC BAA-351]EOU21484.1 hypothetical protein I588_02331 [Enterococcus pallens ATCC BAA-351]OJG75073.1 hypothetical protein RV10_GL004524 [Enterococcus pallens]